MIRAILPTEVKSRWKCVCQVFPLQKERSWCFDVSNTSSIFLHSRVHAHLGFVIAFESTPPFSKALGQVYSTQLFGSISSGSSSRFECTSLSLFKGGALEGKQCN